MNQSIQILLQCRSLVCCSDQFNCLLACLLAWIAASTRDTKCNVCICYKIIIALCLNNSLCVSTNYPYMVKCRINIIKSSRHSAHGIQLSTFGFQPCHLQSNTRPALIIKQIRLPPKNQFSRFDYIAFCYCVAWTIINEFVNIEWRNQITNI